MRALARLPRSLSVLALLALAGGCEDPPDGAPPGELGGFGAAAEAAGPAPLPYRGDALIVRLVTEAAAEHQVPRDVLLALGWAETHFVSQTGALAPAAHEADDGGHVHGDPTACGLFGLDEGEVRDEAAAQVGVSADLLCESPEIEARAAAARLRRLAGGDEAPALDDIAAWVAVLDAWHPRLAAIAFPYAEHVATVMDIGFRTEDDAGDAIYLPPTDGLVAPMTSVDDGFVVDEDGVGLAGEYARPDTSLASWQGPACDYTNASRGSAQIRYVVIHTCEGGFAGCVSTLKNCGGSQVSAHYVVSYTGTAYQLVEEEDIGWHVGCLNGSSIGIEHEGYAGSTHHPDAQMCRSARIVRSITDRYGIPRTRDRIIGHVEANSRFCHGSHWDPGPHWDWTKFMSYVNNGCGCTPSAETCNGRDDDCDGRTDEGVTNACGACGAVPAETCNGRDDDCDGTVDESDVCEVVLLDEQPSAYAPPSSTDVNGDGRADLCARGYSGLRCWLAEDGSWSAPTAAVPWGDTSGWNDVTNYATLRMGDIDGDGRADVCGRANSGVVCALSTGSGFGAHSTWRDGISDSNGWGHPRFYTTLRLADVDGDGREDLCARDNQGFGCWLSNGTAFDRRILGPRWSDASGWGAAKHYGTIRMADVNGDRRADVCGRSAAGMECWLSDGDGFPTQVDGPDWHGGDWGRMHLWSTIRALDFDGDGRDDLCAITGTELHCARSLGDSFDAPVSIALGGGWNDRSNYATLRTGDVDGDRAEDLCLRANAGVRCWRWDGSAFVQHVGPEWSDAVGWDAPAHYQTMRLADFDGDGMEDICARAGAGWRCHVSSGGAFGPAITLADLTNEGGWTEHRYYTTILSGGRACVAEAEVCNGRDDDCDGEIDEDASAEVCNGRDDDCDGAIDEHAAAEVCNGTDDDCDGEVDEGLSCAPADAGPIVRDDGGTPGGRDAGVDGEERPGMISGSCGCRAAGGSAGAPMPLLAALAVLLAVLVRRRA